MDKEKKKEKKFKIKFCFFNIVQQYFINLTVAVAVQKPTQAWKDDLPLDLLMKKVEMRKRQGKNLKVLRKTP